MLDTMNEPRLGTDIGRVIIDGSSHPGGGDTAFFQGDEATMIATPEMHDALPAIVRLTSAFSGRVSDHNGTACPATACTYRRGQTRKG
jgi:hypothetical protein